jgi:hypothetical protein
MLSFEIQHCGVGTPEEIEEVSSGVEGFAEVSLHSV